MPRNHDTINEPIEPVDSFMKRNLASDRDDYADWKKEQDAMRAAKENKGFPRRPFVARNRRPGHIG